MTTSPARASLTWLWSAGLGGDFLNMKRGGLRLGFRVLGFRDEGSRGVGFKCAGFRDRGSRVV